MDSIPGYGLVIQGAYDERYRTHLAARVLAPGGEIRIGDGVLPTRGRVPDGPGPLNLASLEAFAKETGLRLNAHVGLAETARALHAAGHWHWTEPVRTGTP